jgi:hypothetical protein
VILPAHCSVFRPVDEGGGNGSNVCELVRTARCSAFNPVDGGGDNGTNIRPSASRSATNVIDGRYNTGSVEDLKFKKKKDKITYYASNRKNIMSKKKIFVTYIDSESSSSVRSIISGIVFLFFGGIERISLRIDLGISSITKSEEFGDSIVEDSTKF